MTIEPISSIMTVQAQNTAAAKNAATKVTTEENASEYNPANVKPIDKIDQTTAVVENAQGKEQSNTSADPKGEQQQHVTNEQIKKNLVGAGNNAVNIQLYQGDWTLDLSYQEVPDGIPEISSVELI